jgi:hypothetical protein
MAMKKIENLGFAFMAIGMAVIMMAIWFIPIQVTITHPVEIKKVVSVVVHESFTPKEQVLVAAFRHGWTGAQWTCLNQLITIENPGWDPKRRNPDSTATGLFQVLRSISGRWFGSYSAADQARLGTKYISARYGNPCKALTFHLLNGYF